jgi:hypothetical protein
MSGRRGFGGWLGALGGRLQGRTRKGAAGAAGAAAEPSPPDLDQSAAQRLDDALAGLRQRVPESDQDGSETSTPARPSRS